MLALIHKGRCSCKDLVAPGRFIDETFTQGQQNNSSPLEGED